MRILACLRARFQSLICALVLLFQVGCGNEEAVSVCSMHVKEFRSSLREQRLDEIYDNSSEVLKRGYSREDSGSFLGSLPHVLNSSDKCELQSWTTGLRSEIGYAVVLRYRCRDGAADFVDELAFRKEDGGFKLYNYSFDYAK